MTFKTVSSLLSIAAATGLVLAPVVAAAQDLAPGAAANAAQDVETADALGLPANISILGKNDPNKRTATAVVNGHVLTGTDIDQRLALLIAANKGQQPSAEEMQRLRAHPDGDADRRRAGRRCGALRRGYCVPDPGKSYVLVIRHRS